MYHSQEQMADATAANLVKVVNLLLLVPLNEGDLDWIATQLGLTPETALQACNLGATVIDSTAAGPAAWLHRNANSDLWSLTQDGLEDSIYKISTGLREMKYSTHSQHTCLKRSADLAGISL